MSVRSFCSLFSYLKLALKQQEHELEWCQDVAL